MASPSNFAKPNRAAAATPPESKSVHDAAGGLQGPLPRPMWDGSPQTREQPPYVWDFKESTGPPSFCAAPSGALDTPLSLGPSHEVREHGHGRGFDGGGEGTGTSFISPTRSSGGGEQLRTGWQQDQQYQPVRQHGPLLQQQWAAGGMRDAYAEGVAGGGLRLRSSLHTLPSTPITAAGSLGTAGYQSGGLGGVLGSRASSSMGDPSHFEGVSLCHQENSVFPPFPLLTSSAGTVQVSRVSVCRGRCGVGNEYTISEQRVPVTSEYRGKYCRS